MKKLIPFSVLLMFLLAMTGCSFMGKSMKQPNYRVDFVKDDFEWSTQLSGEATQTKILMIDWARLFKRTGGAIDGSDRFGAAPFSFSVPIIGSLMSSANVVDFYALYELMNANPGYDIVLYPVFETQAKGFMPFYWRTTVKASARLGKLK